MTMPVQGTYGVRNGMDDRPMMDPDWAANIAVLQNFLYTDMTAEEAIAAGTEDIHKHKTGHCCDDEKENKDA